MPRICISVGNVGLNDIYAIIDYAKSKEIKFVEFRFDTIKETADADKFDDPIVLGKVGKLISYAKDMGVKTIGTNRSAGFNVNRVTSVFKRQQKNGISIDLRRIGFLKSVVESGIDICDAELDISERHITKDFVDFAHSKNSKVILSVHDFGGQVDLPTAIRFYIDSLYLGADYFKLADTVISESDVPCVLEKNRTLHSIKMTDTDSFPEFIVFGMGEKGKITRALSLIYGSYLAYCSSPYGATAPGQTEAEDFGNIMKCAHALSS
ncbi:MAG TPA: type I 3-dehydroquinate dehydratase [bacterium]|nr:type I 3-dehydroquinate dehydratase [bacterium]